MIDDAGGGEGSADEGGEEDAGEAFFFEEFVAGEAGAGGADQRTCGSGEEPDESAYGEGEEELGEAPAFQSNLVEWIFETSMLGVGNGNCR